MTRRLRWRINSSYVGDHRRFQQQILRVNEVLKRLLRTFYIIPRRKVRRKTKAKAKEDAAVAAVSTQATASTSGDVEMGSAPPTEPVAGVIEDEATARKREVEVLTSLVDPSLAADVGCSPHGLYELCGELQFSSITLSLRHLSFSMPGIVTHKGASADGGHYIGWVKKDAIDATLSSPTATPNYDDPGDEWYKFDDDRVSVVKQDKIQGLDGGGEDSTAYILLYRYVSTLASSNVAITNAHSRSKSLV